MFIACNENASSQFQRCVSVFLYNDWASMSASESEDFPKGATGTLVTVQFDDDDSKSTITLAWVRKGGERQILVR